MELLIAGKPEEVADLVRLARKSNRLAEGPVSVLWVRREVAESWGYPMPETPAAILAKDGEVLLSGAGPGLAEVVHEALRKAGIDPRD